MARRAAHLVPGSTNFRHGSLRQQDSPSLHTSAQAEEALDREDDGHGGVAGAGRARSQTDGWWRQVADWLSALSLKTPLFRCSPKKFSAESVLFLQTCPVRIRWIVVPSEQNGDTRATVPSESEAPPRESEEVRVFRIGPFSRHTGCRTLNSFHVRRRSLPTYRSTTAKYETIQDR